MMRTRMRLKLRHVGMVCSVLALLVVSTSAWGTVPGNKAENEIERLARAYRAARTEGERRAVCLDAIDEGVVARDRPVADVDAIFGTSYAGRLPRGGGLETGVVNFHPSPPPPNNSYQAAHIGWYLAFEFDSAGRVQNYYLSNAHQK